MFCYLFNEGLRNGGGGGHKLNFPSKSDTDCCGKSWRYIAKLTSFVVV